MPKPTSKAYQQKLNDLTRQAADPFAAARSLFQEPAQGTAHLVLVEPFQCPCQHKGEIRALVGDYEETRHPRRMCWASSAICWPPPRSIPPCCIYLDNAQNAAGHINENYAREIMELHTMGVGSRL